LNNSIKTNKVEIKYAETNTISEIYLENHCHSQFELIAIIKGDINVIIEDKYYNLTENQTIIIPPLCYHSITAKNTSAYKRITALFDSSYIPNVIQTKFTNNDFCPTISTFHQLDKLKSICQEINKNYYSPLAESLLIQILYNHADSKKEVLAMSTDEFLKKAINYINDHIHQKILLTDFSKHMMLSKSSFCHKFEEKMNISPKQYILQKKFAIANKLLKEGVPATTIAIQLGYENYSNFYRIYLKKYGISPIKIST